MMKNRLLAREADQSSTETQGFGNVDLAAM
jgi:hypothetical protein